MKKYLIIGITFMIILINNSCNEIEFPNENSLIGNWRITSFIMDGNDVTELFSGYIISCEEDGTMTISGNGNTYFCDWEWNDANHSECIIQLHSCDQQSIIWQLQNMWNISDHNENICNFESKGSMHHNKMFWTKVDLGS